MAKATYLQLTSRIARMQAQADEMREKEKRGVVARIKEAIQSYAIAPEELFGAGVQKFVAPKSASKPTAKGSPKSKSKSKISLAARYADGEGNEWVGRGPRPQWLRDALTAGKQLQDFAVGLEPNGAAAHLNGSGKAGGAAPARKKRRAGKAKSTPKFSNGLGQSWTGRGRQPKWFIDAIASGKTVEELTVS